MLFLFLTLIALINGNTYLVSGFNGNDGKCDHVMDGGKCVYPDGCYILMTKVFSNKNVTHIGLTPILPYIDDCNITDKSSQPIYIVYGVNDNCDYVDQTGHLSSGLWNTMFFYCRILKVSSTKIVMITPTMTIK